MTLMKTLSAGAAAIALTTAFATIVPTPAMAQSTTSDVRGIVTDPSGAPISGATVTITDVLTGTTRSVRTTGNGGYAVRGLNPAGRYSVRVSSTSFADKSVTDITLSVGETSTVNFGLEGASGADEIIVVASRASVIDVATGPAATFNFDDLQNSPAISRDIKDIIRQDPRLFIDQSEGNGLQCAGASSRFNSLTVDGIKLNDNFGLNSNGFPTERLPFPFDAISQVAVELAPFDVEYGGFTACNINAVTRSGTNEFHGSAWGDYTNDSLRGGSIEGSEFDKGDFRKVRFGATLSGPIIKDKLFFFGAYEKFNDTEVIVRGPAELGAVGVQGVSQAQLDRIANIARTIYDFDPGDLPSTFDESDEKILLKLDYNINDNHRAAFTYNYINGNNLTASDDDPDEYEFFNHYYIRSTKLTTYSGQIFSNWTDNFSTELRFNHTTNDTGQNSVNGAEFGEVQIDTFNNGQSATVYLGADDSRHSNKLDTKTINFKFKGDYSANNHLFSFGYEREHLEIFNLFVQHSQGQYDFDDVRGSSLAADPDANIDLFELLLADNVFYGNAGGTNNPDDAAANLKFSTNTAYVQDNVTFDEHGLTLTLGLRYDWWTSGDVPRENANFIARNGFTNTNTFDGEGVLQPRFGFNYEVKDNITLHGGAGIYSGGNPNVWLANSFQNDGQTSVQIRAGETDLNTITWINDEGGLGRPIFGVPQVHFDTVALGAAANTGVNAIDDNFKIPSQWKFALGGVWEFDMPAGLGQGYSLQADLLYTKDREAAKIIDATLEQVGTAIDGRPIYVGIDRADPDCVDPLAAACSSRAFNQDFILTNSDGGRQYVISAALSKDYAFDGGWDANWTLGYAYVDSKDRNPMPSSVAFSNFALQSVDDPNNPALGTSNNEVPHRMTLSAGVRKAFWGDYETKVNLFGTISQSRPYSINFIDAGEAFGDFIDGRHLAYIPTGPGDSNIIFETGVDSTAFFNTLNGLGLSEFGGMIAPKNAFQSDWFSQWDLRIEQEFPGAMKGHKLAGFVVIENIGNLLNDDWGVINQAGFPGGVEFYEINERAGCADCAAGSAFGPNGEYIITGFNDVTPDSLQSPVTDASVWEIRFGVRYEF